MFVTSFGDIKVYALNNKCDDHIVLLQYFKYILMHTSLHMDNTKYMDSSKQRDKVLSKEGGIKTSCTEPHTPQKNDKER